MQVPSGPLEVYKVPACVYVGQITSNTLQIVLAPNVTLPDATTRELKALVDFGCEASALFHPSRFLDYDFHTYPEKERKSFFQADNVTPLLDQTFRRRYPWRLLTTLLFLWQPQDGGGAFLCHRFQQV